MWRSPVLPSSLRLCVDGGRGTVAIFFVLFTYLSHCSLVVPYWKSCWNLVLLVKLLSLSAQLVLSINGI